MSFPKGNQSLHRTNRGERGQSVVEVAIGFPILLLLLVGTIDFGMGIFSYSILRDAAQEGAFYGSFNPTNKADIENRARNISPRGENEVFSSAVNLRDKDRVKVDVKTLGKACQGSTNNAINRIQVTVSYNYPEIMPFAGLILGSTIPLKGTATNIILQPSCP